MIRNNLNSMSQRQQLLFVMQMSQKRRSDWDNNLGDENQLKNPNQVYEEQRQKLKQEDIVAHPERWRMLAQSMSAFIPLKKNKYLERNKQILHPNEYQGFLCSCQPNSFQAQMCSTASIDCGSQCLNMSVNQDCIPQICPVGDHCRNRRFTKHQNAYVYPVKTSYKGWGLCAGEQIPKGTFIMQYVGEVFYEDSEIGKKRQEAYKNSTCTYMMRTENGEVIDPTYCGNIARFINHSCDPNCETRKWNVQKETMVGIFARKDIAEDEELSFDYQFDSFRTPFQICYCGTEKCKGYLGLGIYDDSDSDVEEKRNANSPNCSICANQVLSKEELLLCRGLCHSVCHLQCAIKTDEYVKMQVKSGQFNQRKYVCQICLQTSRKKKNKDKPAISPVSQDPEYLKFCDNELQYNQILDKVIQREIRSIELKQEKQTGQKKRKDKHYSQYYNFYFNLCKKLHKRIKEDITKLKFRKTQQDSDSLESSSSSSEEEELRPKRKTSERTRGVNRPRGRGGRLQRKRSESSSSLEFEQPQEINNPSEDVEMEECEEESEYSKEQIKEVASVEVIKRIRRESFEQKDSKEQIQNYMSQIIEDFVDLNQKHTGEVRITKINVYQEVFNMVIVNNIDLWECVNDLSFFWDRSWGNFMTVKIQANQGLFKAILNLLQECTNRLMKNDHLLEKVQADVQFLASMGPDVHMPPFCLPFLIMKLLVPKNFIKKLIGYQNRVLNELKKRYQVEFEFDQTLVTDFVFQQDETSPIYIFGKGAEVIKSCFILQNNLDKLQLRTLSLSKELTKYSFDNIKDIKSLVDPCEIRIKKLKEKSEIKHPFFFVLNTSQDICLIGSEEELRSGERKLFQFFQERRDAPDIYKTSLSLLLPIQMRPDLAWLKEKIIKQMPDITIYYYDPVFPRKQITISISGTWSRILQARRILKEITDSRFNQLNQPSFRTFEEFQRFTFHKQLKFCLKILRRVKLENDYRFLSYWDTSSHILEDAGVQEIISEHITTFDQHSLLGQVEIKEMTFDEKIRKDDYRSLVQYLKVFDIESCLNALFVLANSSYSFESLAVRLQLGKEKLIQMMIMILQGCMRDYDYPNYNVYQQIDFQRHVSKAAAKKIRQQREMLQIENKNDQDQDNRNYDRYQYYQKDNNFEFRQDQSFRQYEQYKYTDYRNRRSRSRSQDMFERNQPKPRREFYETNERFRHERYVISPPRQSYKREQPRRYEEYNDYNNRYRYEEPQREQQYYEPSRFNRVMSFNNQRPQQRFGPPLQLQRHVSDNMYDRVGFRDRRDEMQRVDNRFVHQYKKYDNYQDEFRDNYGNR